MENAVSSISTSTTLVKIFIHYKIRYLYNTDN